MGLLHLFGEAVRFVFVRNLFVDPMAEFRGGQTDIRLEYPGEKVRVAVAREDAHLLYGHIGAAQKLAGVSHTQRNNVFAWGASNNFTENNVIT